MKILIIEDDLNKLRQLESAIGAEAEKPHDVSTRGAYQSGLKAALSVDFDLILLDMALPTYDISPTEPGGRFRAYAGREILSELQRRGKRAKVIVVTQFESFGEGKDAMTLEQLRSQLQREYSHNYVDTIFYSASESGWRKLLLERVDELDSLK